MSSSAHVQSIQAIEDFKGTLAQFRAEAQGALDAASLEIQRTQDWIQERLQHWQNVVRRCEAVVAQAQAALTRCLNSGYYDREGHYHPPNCSAQETALYQAQRQLIAAREELGKAQQAKQAIEQAVAAYQREAQRLMSMLNGNVVKASAFLARAIATLQAYVATSISATTSGLTSEAGVSAITSGRKGSDFEAWANENIFRGKRRIAIPIELNEHLADANYDDAAMGLHKSRKSDNYYDADGSLWDAKAYGENSTIDPHQMDDYSMMARAGKVFDENGKEVPITSINYVFSSRVAAEKNSSYLSEVATAWYVDWQSDGSGVLKMLGEE